MMKAWPVTIASLICGALGLTGLDLMAGDGQLKERSPAVRLDLPHVTSGAAAIAALGDHAAAVAAAHGMSGQQMKRLLLKDSLLKLDRTGRLFFEEPGLVTPLGGDPVDTAGTAEAAPLPQEAFLLHSLPGARRLIYLDFDGHLLSGTAWNASYTAGADIVCPPWDLDGDPASFSETERTRIVQIWQRVSEDFAPFEVDVTTEYPGEAALSRSELGDDFYGVRVLISAISSHFGNYGGFAYVGAFNDVGDYYKPALVFPEKLANSEKYIAEAIAHETGHTMGLSHDGKTDGTGYYSGQGAGETGWAPIMGAGYYKNLSQWSKGEYALANNKQDDLALLKTYVPARPDDHGGSLANATVLPGGAALAATGVVQDASDIDAFRFVTGAGTVSIQVTPFERGPNLDILAQLYDVAGNLIAENNPLDSLASQFRLGLSAGTYFLLVRATGAGDPMLTGYSSYGSAGQYTISGTMIATSGTLPPTADFMATSPSGAAPLPVQFSSSAMDPDGAIVGWHWAFGDGSVSTEASPSHTYFVAGAYTVTLTVTDNSGLTASKSGVIQVLPNPGLILRVESISLSVAATLTGTTANARVTVTDLNGIRIPGATISGAWSGIVTGAATAATDAMGTALLRSPTLKKSGIATFTVTLATKDGMVFDPSQNRVTTASLSAVVADLSADEATPLQPAME